MLKKAVEKKKRPKDRSLHSLSWHLASQALTLFVSGPLLLVSMWPSHSHVTSWEPQDLGGVNEQSETECAWLKSPHFSFIKMEWVPRSDSNGNIIQAEVRHLPLSSWDGKPPQRRKRERKGKAHLNVSFWEHEDEAWPGVKSVSDH